MIIVGLKVTDTEIAGILILGAELRVPNWDS